MSVKVRPPLTAAMLKIVCAQDSPLMGSTAIIECLKRYIPGIAITILGVSTILGLIDDIAITKLSNGPPCPPNRPDVIHWIGRVTPDLGILCAGAYDP